MSLLLLSLVFFLALPSWITIFRNLNLDTYFWQTKEYRLDRVISQIKYREGSNYRNLFFTLVKVAIFINLVIFYYFPEASYLLISAAILFLLHFIESEEFLRSSYKKRLPRPRLRSTRNMLIVGSSMFWMLLPYLLFSFWLIGLPVGDSTLHNVSNSFQPVTVITDVSFVEILPQIEDGLLIIPLASLIVLVISIFNVSLDLLTPLFVSTFVLITEPMALFKRRNMVQLAKSKLKKLNELKVVAITGSYGKTTTKEILFQILSNKFITAKTPENHNTDVGIAQAVMNFVNEDTEVFIAEMGAYKKGEITKSTKLAPPDIAIVTGVEGQHLSLFGSIEKLFEAKYEIIEGLKDNGFAILNGNNEYTVRMAERTNKEKMMYFSVNKEINLVTNSQNQDDLEEEKEGKFPINSNIYARDIKLGDKGVMFTLIIEGTEHSISTNIPGLHNASNLLAAIAVGLKLGIKAEDLVEIINDMNFEVPYLKIIPAVNDSKVIDDGYNVSPTGFLSGLLMLSTQEVKGKRWVLTQGLLELGTDRDKVYKKLAKDIVKKADALITSDNDLHKFVVEANSKFKSILAETPYKLKNAYIENVRKDDLVLIEGSLPGVVLSAIKTVNNE